MTPPNALTNRQIVRAALVVLLGFIASGALGLVLQAIVLATFGAGSVLDAFTAAQRIPEMLFVLVAGGALGSSFIPVFARYLQMEDQAGAWRLASAVMTLAFMAAAALAILLALFAPQIVSGALARDASADLQALTSDLTRIMLLTVPVFSVSGMLMGILNAHQSFTFPALAAAMYNLGQIFGVLVLTRMLPPLVINGESSANVYGLAWGAVVGASLHLLIQLPGLRRIPARLRIAPSFRTPGAREVLSLMIPRTLGLAVVQINFLVNVALAFPPRMVEGSVSAFSAAWRLMFFVLGIVGQSLGTALFPSLSALAASGDMAGFKDRLATAMRGVLFVALPASVGLILVGELIIRALFERGEWSLVASRATAWALGFLAIGMAGHALLELLARAFYALEDTRTPVTVGIGAMVTNIILSFILIHVIGDPNDLARGAFAGLALANSLTTLGEAAVLWLILRRGIGGLKDRAIVRGAAQTAIAAAGMGVAVGWFASILQPLGLWLQAGAATIGGALVFFVLAWLLGMSEARSLPQMLIGRLRRT